MKKSIVAIFFLTFAIEITLKILSYIGDPTDTTRKLILTYFTEEDIKAGIEYHRSGFATSFILSIIKNLFLIWFVFSKYPKKLEDIISAIAKNKFWLSIILFVTSIYTVLTILSLPLSWYFGFYLEHQFGFSNMSIGFWFWTELKSFLLTLPFLNFGALVAIYIIKKLRFYWVFVVPVSGVIAGLVISVLYPIFILPMFYKTEPIQDGSLKTKIVSLAKKSDVNASEIFVIKESEYSKHTNAFFVGFGDRKKIYLFDTLIQTNSESEIISVLGHEIGHWKFNHQLWGILFEFIGSLFEFLLIYFILSNLRNSNQIREFHSLSTIPIFLLLSGIISSLSHPISSTISRKMEASADKYALVSTNDTKAFISSEIKLAKENKSRLDVNPIVEFWKYSHPKTIDRIKMAEEYKIEERNNLK